jgi:hypothetical protein
MRIEPAPIPVAPASNIFQLGRDDTGRRFRMVLPIRGGYRKTATG